MDTLSFPIASRRPSIFSDLELFRDNDTAIWLARQRLPVFRQVLHIDIRVPVEYELLTHTL